MALILSKFLPPLIFPTGFTVILCLLAAWFALRGRPRIAGFIALLGAAVLYAAASPYVSQALIHRLEAQNPPLADPPRTAAIVLLGGGMMPAGGMRIHPETNGAGDRVIHAARLWKQGRAPRIVATGGYISFLVSAEGSEADLYASLLTELFDVPPEAILRVRDSKTTHDDATLTAKLFDETGMPKEILLVTSASHMPRAAALFRKQGFTVHPAPTDFHFSGGGSLHRLLPSPGALHETTLALNEYLGTWVYRRLGRL